MDNISDVWAGLPADAQDAAVFGLLLVPAIVVGFLVLRGYRIGPLVSALLWRFRWTNLLFILLIALSVGLGIALIAQERALRQGSARAAAGFDVIVAAPGDRTQLLMAAVYLQQTAVPLVGGDVLAALQSDPQIDLVAPIAFGDSYLGKAVVGTTAAFVGHLSGPLAEGRMFAADGEAVAGALVPVEVGHAFTPVHGLGEEGSDVHAGTMITVVGRMAPTGSPWDRAILLPIETVWEVHGIASGHAPEHEGQIGPPFDPAFFPGTPAFLVRSDEIFENYAIQSRYNSGTTMAFFPGAVLAQMHALLGDVRQAMSMMAVLTQVLVAAAVFSGLVALARLFARRFALLRALGAPARFVFALVWSYSTALIGAGCMLGLVFGWLAARVLSAYVTTRTDILVLPRLGWPELTLVAAFFSAASLLALLPAIAAYRRSVIRDLRST